MRCIIPMVLLVFVGCGSERVDFNASIRPILNEKCVSCHGGVRRRSELSLQFRADALTGGKSGEPAIVPGDPGSSRLMQLVTRSNTDERMPKDEAALSSLEIANLRQWIEEGAEWEPHWAYVAPTQSPMPEVGDEDWVRSPIDRFVLARLETDGLSHSVDAECRVLARRVTLDLTGLPADADRVDALCATGEASDAAYADFVDELLEAPGFGERWASMWLDLARYADSKGYEADRHRTIWRYRDWVVRAFDDDMPFDQFTIEQLAGDLLPDPSRDQLIATAFNRNSMTNGEGGTDDEEHRVAAVVDRVGTTWEVWQGTTMACTQCHGHPYDPFRQEDFYESMAVFNNSADWDQPSEVPVLREYTDGEAGRIVEQELMDLDDRLQSFLASAASTEVRAGWEASLGDPLVAGKLLTTVQNEVLRIARLPLAERSPHQEAFIRARFGEVHESTEALRKERQEIVQRLGEFIETTTPIMRELPPAESRVTRLMARGNFLTQEHEVKPGTPDAIAGTLPASKKNRLGFAEWLVSEENPLTARVTVNRFWAQLFGTGIVQTLEDFGTVGEPPSHPELLDWLAVSFQTEMDWSMKSLLKEMVTSSTYRQSAAVTHQDDPSNRLLSRGPRLRLSGEQLRDQALAVSGLLSSKQHGPPVMPHQPDGIWKNPYNGDQWTASEGEDQYRRAVYTYWRRTAPYPSMVTFDSPSREFCVSRRIGTNTPLQALVTLNDPVFWEASEALARRMEAEPGSHRNQLAAGYRWATASPATDESLDVLEALVEGAADETTGMAIAANVILNLDEVITH